MRLSSARYGKIGRGLRVADFHPGWNYTAFHHEADEGGWTAGVRLDLAEATGDLFRPMRLVETYRFETEVPAASLEDAFKDALELAATLDSAHRMDARKAIKARRALALSPGWRAVAA